MSERRVIRLVERRGRNCRLLADDIDFLLTQHAAQLELRPTGRRGVVRVTPRGYVGVIEAPSSRLEIEPKIPLVNLLHLLDPDEVIGVRAGSGGLLELLAGRFAQMLGQQLALGLRGGYVEQAEALPHLRGRLDMAAQMREVSGDRLHCRFEELSTDTSWNRQFKAIAQRLEQSSMVSDSTRLMLRASLANMSGIDADEPSEAALTEALRRPDLADQRGLLELARLLIGGSASYLIDLERAFERYITRGLIDTCAGSDFQIDVQPSFAFHSSADQPELRVRPDVVLRCDGRALIVVDAKWKRLCSGPESADVHQALAYAVALEVPCVVLVYPGTRNRCWSYQVQEVELRIQRLQVRGNRDSMRAAMQRWAGELKRWRMSFR